MSKEKPSDNYYIKKLCKQLDSASNISDVDITLLTTDYYKFQKLDDNERLQFISSLKTFVGSTIKSSNEKMSVIPKYKYIVQLKKSKYLVDIYDNKMLAVYLWDGDFTKDFITMSKGYPYENLYDISQSINGYDD